MTTMSPVVAGAERRPAEVMTPAEVDQVTDLSTAPVTEVVNCAEVLPTVTLAGPEMAPTATGMTLRARVRVTEVPATLVTVRVKMVLAVRVPEG